MVEQKTSSGLDFEVLRRAVGQRNAELLVSLYAEDAEVRIVNRKAPPSSPFELHGKEEIAQHLRNVASRDMTHRVEYEVIGAERVAFNVVCRFPNGNGLLAAATLELRDGKIVREVDVQAWDE